MHRHTTTIDRRRQQPQLTARTAEQESVRGPCRWLSTRSVTMPAPGLFDRVAVAAADSLSRYESPSLPCLVPTNSRFVQQQLRENAAWEGRGGVMRASEPSDHSDWNGVLWRCLLTPLTVHWFHPSPGSHYTDRRLWFIGGSNLRLLKAGSLVDISGVCFYPHR